MRQLKMGYIQIFKSFASFVTKCYETVPNAPKPADFNEIRVSVAIYHNEIRYLHFCYPLT